MANKLESQWVPIFRAGKHTSMEGTERDYTESDLDHIVQAYNPDYHEAPAVIGHPVTDAPAYGWVRGLKREGSTLLAKFGEVNPDFDQMVQSGAFKKRSASFYVKPDGLELRHVGFLGAQAPAVKGLANIKFEEGDIASIEFEEGSMAAGQEKSVREQIAEFFAEMFGGKKEAVAVVGFSEADAKRLIDAAVKPLADENAELKKKLDAQAASFSDREKKIAQGEHSTRVQDAINKLRSAGKWVPAFAKMGLTEVFGELAQRTETVEFGEADKDGKKAKAAPLDILVSFLEKLPKIVPGGVQVDGGNVVQFADGARKQASNAVRFRVDQNSAQLSALAEKRALESNGKVSFAEALSTEAALHPELTVPGGQAAGAV